MDWLPIVSTALGGIIGWGSTFLADQVRWRHDIARREAESNRAEIQRKSEIRNGIYVQYLAALSRLRNGLRETAHDPELSRSERTNKLRTTFLESGAYELRFQVQIVAPESVMFASEAAYKSLRRLRIHIEDGASYQDGQYLNQRNQYHGKLADLKRAIRDDLRIEIASDVHAPEVDQPLST